MVRLTLLRDPFHFSGLQQVDRRSGSTVRELLAEVGWDLDSGHDTRVLVGDRIVPDELWSRVRPKDDALVVVRAVPRDPATIAGIVEFFKLVGAALSGQLAIDVSIAGLTFTVPAAVVTGVSVGVVSFGVSFGINALIGAPSEPDLGSSGGKSASPTLRQVGNALRPFEPIPEVYGRHRIFPPFGALPFTEIVGGINVARLLYLIGHGPVTFSDTRIGETPIGDFPEAVFELREGRPGDADVTLYKDVVFQTNPNIRFTTPDSDAESLTGAYSKQTTADQVEEIGVDLSFAGLIRFNEHGKRRVFTLSLEIEYSIAGAESWQDATAAALFGPLDGNGAATLGAGPAVNFSGATTEPFIHGFRWQVGTKAKYDVRIRRIELEPRNALPGGADATNVFADVTWTVLRAYRLDAPPILTANKMALLALKIPLTEQNQGQVKDLSTIATRELKVYDPGDTLGLGVDSNNWTLSPSPTRNPAAAFLNVLRGDSNTNPVPDASIDFPAISKWFEDNEADPFDSCDAIGAWSTVDTALSIETSIKIEGSGSFKSVASGATPAQLLEASLGPIDWSGRLFRFAVRIESAANLSATDGVRITLESALGVDSAEWRFGTDDGVTAGQWFQGVIDIDNDTPDVSAGSFDSSQVRRVGMIHNVVGAASGRIAYWDRLQAGFQRTFDAVIDFKTTVYELARDIARSARADFSEVDGLISVIQDAPDKAPVQLITQRNAHEMSFTRRWDELPHALKVQYTDEENGYDPNGEVIVHDDGFSDDGAGGTTVATRFQTLVLFGAWNAADAWKEGRFFLAANRLRPRIFRLKQGAESLVARRGDMVLFEYADALIGQGSGKVKSIEGSVTGVVVDAVVVFTFGVSYTIQFRMIDTANARFGFVSADVVNPSPDPATPVETTTITFVDPIVSGLQPAAGDLWAFGQKSIETRECVVKSIRRDTDLFATIELLDYSPAIYTADTAPIPAFAPGTGAPVSPRFEAPQVPEIVEVISDERALAFTLTGALLPRVIVRIRQSTPGLRVPPAFYEVQLRVNDPGTGYMTDWRILPRVQASDDKIVIEGVDEGLAYDIRVRSISLEDRVSTFALIQQHLVVGKSTPPFDVKNFRLEGSILWWDVPNDGETVVVDLAGFRIRYNAGVNRNWDGSTSAHSEILTVPPFSTASIPPGIKTILCRAEDLAGNLSVVPAVVIADIPQVPIDNVVLITDYHANGFAGVFGESIQVDALDVVTDWNTLNCTRVPDPTVRVEGDASLKMEAGVGFAFGIDRINWGTPDWTDATVRISLFIPTGTMADRVQFEVGSIGFSDFHFINLAIGSEFPTGVWHDLELDLSNPPGTVGSPDITNIAWVRIFLTDNVFSTDFFYADDIRVIGGVQGSTEVEVGTGDLVTKDISGTKFWTGTDSVLFWSGDDSKLFWTTPLFGTGTWTTPVVPDEAAVPSQWTLDTDKDFGARHRLDYRVDGPNLFWSGIDALNFWQDDAALFWESGFGVGQVKPEFVPWPGQLEAKRQKHELRLTLFGGNVIARVTKFQAQFDVPDIVEEFVDLAIASGGTRLPITKTYREIAQVLATLKPGGVNTVGVRVQDLDAKNGPLMEILDTSGSPTSGVIDARTRGF